MSETIAAQVKDDDEGGEKEEMKEDEDDEGVGRYLADNGKYSQLKA